MKFNWGTGAITPYGRDYISARWTGKLLSHSTETYTVYLRADDAARLYIDHELVVDAWEGDEHTDSQSCNLTVQPSGEDKCS